MKVRAHLASIKVSITDSLHMSACEVKFLRTMARFCIANGMRGSAACKRLDAALADAGIKPYDDTDGPVYGVFEVES